jgi:hypothetical protein
MQPELPSEADEIIYIENKIPLELKLKVRLPKISLDFSTLISTENWNTKSMSTQIIGEV